MKPDAKTPIPARKTRSKFHNGTKSNAVSMVLSGKYTVREVARRLGVKHASNIRHWVAAAKKNGTVVLSNGTSEGSVGSTSVTPRKSPIAEELRAAGDALERVTAERDFFLSVIEFMVKSKTFVEACVMAGLQLRRRGER